jgi:hypothetical protein
MSETPTGLELPTPGSDLPHQAGRLVKRTAGKVWEGTKAVGEVVVEVVPDVLEAVADALTDPW